MDAGVMKPSGHISGGIFNEWKTGVTRLSQEKVTHADKIRIINAVRTYAELKHFMAARDRTMPPEELDLRPQVLLGHGHRGPCAGAQRLALALQAGPVRLATGRDPVSANGRDQETTESPSSGHRTAYAEFPQGRHRGSYQAEKRQLEATAGLLVGRVRMSEVQASVAVYPSQADSVHDACPLCQGQTSP
jgi:hypothetical protein